MHGMYIIMYQWGLIPAKLFGKLTVYVRYARCGAGMQYVCSIDAVCHFYDFSSL
jgi:hypothetical protein